MANNKKKQQHRQQTASSATESGDKPITLKDLLGAGTVAKLKQQAEEMKLEEAKLREAKRKEAEQAREAERKARENDFEYLLNNSAGVGRKYN